MQWEGQSAWVQVSASNEELQKMFAERERTARPHQPPSRTQELVSMGGGLVTQSLEATCLLDTRTCGHGQNFWQRLMTERK